MGVKKVNSKFQPKIRIKNETNNNNRFKLRSRDIKQRLRVSNTSFRVLQDSS